MTRGYSRIAHLLGGPLDWSLAQKCLWISGVALCGIVWHLVIGLYLFARPDVAPYVDRRFLPIAFRVALWGLLGGWLGVAAAALWLGRRSPDSRALAHVTVLWVSVTIAIASYFFGHYTSLFTGALSIGSLATGLILFDEAIMLPAALLVIALIALTTAFEQLGWIPYAPMLVAAPFEHGQLSSWWLVGFGAVPFAFFLLYVPLFIEVIRRWRDREAGLAVTSEHLARANDLISRYVASQLAEQIRAGNFDVVETHQRRRLTLFFSDIRDFSEIADHVEPEDLNEVLNEYLSEMTTIAERFGGTIDKFVGDAIMIFFGAPLPADDRENALRAVQMALEMQARLGELREKWSRDGFERPLEVRIGINTGHASIGNFGSKSRMDYTAIGRQVNLAARLQAGCEPGKILISHSTWSLVRDAVVGVPKGEIQVKGLRDPVKVYEVASRAMPASELPDGGGHAGSTERAG